MSDTGKLRLGVNIDHVATVRNARGGAYPDPVRAAKLAEEAGADVAPKFAKLAIAAPGSQQFVTLLLMYAGGYLLANRFFFGIGAGNTMSREKAREERGGK